jgi:hypothetical protein
MRRQGRAQSRRLVMSIQSTRRPDPQNSNIGQTSEQAGMSWDCDSKMVPIDQCPPEKLFRSTRQPETRSSNVVQISEQVGMYHDSQMVPINRCPPEILLDIFGHFVVLPCFMPFEKENPLLLGRVCRRWCMVSLGTPRLWCSLKWALGAPDLPTLVV